MSIFKIFAFLILLTSCQSTRVSKKAETKSGYHVDIALGFLRHNKNPEAIEELESAIKLNPYNAKAYHYLGMCLYQRNRMDRSVNAFLKSLSINPSDTEVRNDLITIYLEQKNYLKAYRHARISVTDLTYTQPDKSLFLRSQAALNLAQEDPRFLKIAEKDLKNIVKLNPNHCGALYHLGRIYSKKTKFKRSYVLFNKSLKSCQLEEDKLKSLNALIPLSKKFGLVYQWGRYKQLKLELAKKTKN